MMNANQPSAQGTNMLQSMSERTLSLVIYSISIIVVILVAFLLYVPQAITIEGLNVMVLPKLNAYINSACTILLTLGFYFIRNKRIAAHRMMMMSAFGLSILFCCLMWRIIHRHLPPHSVVKELYASCISRS